MTGAHIRQTQQSLTPKSRVLSLSTVLPIRSKHHSFVIKHVLVKCVRGCWGAGRVRSLSGSVKHGGFTSTSFLAA